MCILWETGELANSETGRKVGSREPTSHGFAYKRVVGRRIHTRVHLRVYIGRHIHTRVHLRVYTGGIYTPGYTSGYTGRHIHTRVYLRVYTGRYMHPGYTSGCRKGGKEAPENLF